MQLNRDAAARRQLMMASFTLLGAAAARAQQAPPAADPAPAPAAPGADTAELTFDSSLAYYQESGRISAIEPMVSLRMDDGNGTQHLLTAVFDSLSGSSPNGALTSNKPQTFATPSGNSLTGSTQTYTTASGQSTVYTAPTYVQPAGTLPVDPNYKDNRIAVTASSTQPLHLTDRTSFGGTFSLEHDFLSFSGNVGYQRDFNQKNTTLALGLSDEFDQVKPIGGTPVAGSDYSLFQKTGNRSKNGIGLQAGVTQVMNPRWLMQFNLTADRFSGYLDDPYKIVSVLDALGNTTGYLNERRPEERLRRSAWLESRLAGHRTTWTASGRYMTDDWGIHSQTLESWVRWWNTDHDRYLQPSVRWYRQDAARFYTPWLDATRSTYGQLASADERLGAFHGTTLGLKYGVRRTPQSSDPSDTGSELGVRVQWYRQSADQKRANPTVLQGLDLYPSLSTFMLQVDYRFGF